MGHAMQQHGIASAVAPVSLQQSSAPPAVPPAVGSLFRLSPAPGLLAVGVLAPALLAAVLALPARPALAAHATEAEMELYTRLAALNVCIARAAGVEFDLAAGVAAETITQWIQGNHESGIAPVSATALSLDELRRGSINSAVLGASELCPQLLPKEVMRDVEKAVKASAPDSSPKSPSSP